MSSKTHIKLLKSQWINNSDLIFVIAHATISPLKVIAVAFWQSNKLLILVKFENFVI